MFRLLTIQSLLFPFLKLVWRLFIDKRVPIYTKIIPLTAIIYLITPYDMIPDRIPILGQLDDLIATIIFFTLFIAASPKGVLADQTLGRKLRQMQEQMNSSTQQDSDTASNTTHTVKAEYKYVDETSEENRSTNTEK